MKPPPDAELQAGTTPGRRRGHWALDCLGLIVLWALLTLPNAGLREYRMEEGRRALPVATMLATGDWIMPTIWGQPYFSKPPGYQWAVAVLHADGREITPLGLRAPSLLATLGTALLLYGLGRAHLGRGTGWLAAVMFLWTPLVLEKAPLGETDALFGFLVFASSAAAWSAVRAGPGGWWAAVLAGALLALALFTKGPAGLVFPPGALLGAWSFDRACGKAALRRGTLVLVLALALLAAWAYVVASGYEGATEDWFKELTRTKSPAQNFGEYMVSRVEYIVSVPPSFLPASLVVLLVLARSDRKEWLRPEAVRVALGVILVGVVFFFFYPRTRPRYAYPIAPWVALVGGYVLARSFVADPAQVSVLARRWLVWALGVLGVVGGVAAPVVLASLPDPVPALDGPGILAVVLVAAAGGAALWMQARGRPAAALACAFAVPILIQVLYATQVVPFKASRETRRELAAELEQALPEGGRLFTNSWQDFNVLIHVQRAITFAKEPEGAVGVGDLLLVQDTPEEVAARETEGWSVVHRVPWGDLGNGLAVLRRGR